MSVKSCFEEFAARLRDFVIESSTRVADQRSFDSLALELFALQFEHNLAYRRICDARHATPQTIEHWTQIPAVPTTAFKESELSCLSVQDRTFSFHSSGTTQQRPSRHFHNAESLAIYEDSVLAWFVAQVFPPGRALLSPGRRTGTKTELTADFTDFTDKRPEEEYRGIPVSSVKSVKSVVKIFSEITNSSARRRTEQNMARRAEKGAPYPPSLTAEPLATGDCQLAILTPSPTQGPHSSLVHMFETIQRALGAGESAFLGRVGSDGGWTLDLERTTVVLKQFAQTKQPVLLLGTAFSFVHLLDYLAAQSLRFQLPPGSRVVETGGYKGRSREVPKRELHALIAYRLGIAPEQIISEYGMSELSSQAYARATHSSRFLFPPWASAQIISPETGREVGEGETGLIRVFDLANVYSVMAIQTEDLGIRRANGFELLGRATLAEPRGCSLMAV